MSDESRKVYLVPSKPVSLGPFGSMSIQNAINRLELLESCCPNEAKGALRGYFVGRNEYQPVIVGIIYGGTKQQQNALVSWLRNDFLPSYGFTRPPYDEGYQQPNANLERARSELAEILEEVSYQQAAGTGNENRERTGEQAILGQEPEKLRVACPACGHHYHVLRSYVGRRARCKNCGHVFLIESSETMLNPDLS